MGAELFVVGSCNLDMQLRVLHLPRAGETQLTQGFARSAGGKGANQAAAAARLGASVAMLGALGNDDAGNFLVASLQRIGVDTAPIQRVDEPTGVAAILLTPDGQNSIVLVPGANAALQPGHVRAVASRLQKASLILMQLETPLAVLEEVLRATTSPVMLDPAPAAPLSKELLHCLAWFTPNAAEAEFYLRRGPHNTPSATDALDCMRALQELGPRNILLKLGEAGAGMLTEEGEAYFVSAPRVQAVDTTGAGDTMNAAFAVALGNGQPLSEALADAVAAASLSVQRPGAMAAAPTRAEVTAFRVVSELQVQQLS